MIDLLAFDPQAVLHQAFFGAVAAAGFGVLFNFGPRNLAWCAAVGFAALAVRTLALEAEWSLEAASFAAAATASCIAVACRRPLGAAANSIALAGCIPMVPGAFFSQALLGFLALTAPHADDAQQILLSSLQAFLRVVFTLGAVGAGLAIPSHLFRQPDF